MVLATIGAIHSRLVLDTGSDVHLLTKEIVEAAGLPLDAMEDESGTDHAGAQVASWFVGAVPIRLTGATGSGGQRVLPEVIAIPAPAAFIDAGIGEALSPQRLDPSAYAVLDHVADELLLVDGSPADVAAFLRERRPRPAVLALPRSREAGVPLVQAAIDGYPVTPFLVNTGSRDTEVDPVTVPGLPAGELHTIGRSVSGAPVLAGTAGPQVLQVAGMRVALPSVMLRPEMGDPPAMLGQDVLRGSVLAVGPDPAGPVLWQVATLGDAG